MICVSVRIVSFVFINCPVARLLLLMRWVERQRLPFYIYRCNIKCIHTHIRWLLTTWHSYLTITSDLVWLLLSFCQFFCCFMAQNCRYVRPRPRFFLPSLPTNHPNIHISVSRSVRSLSVCCASIIYLFSSIHEMNGPYFRSIHV